MPSVAAASRAKTVGFLAGARPGSALTVLGQRIHAVARSDGFSLDDLTAMSAKFDPYRADTVRGGGIAPKYWAQCSTSRCWLARAAGHAAAGRLLPIRRPRSVVSDRTTGPVSSSRQRIANCDRRTGSSVRPRPIENPIPRMPPAEALRDSRSAP